MRHKNRGRKFGQKRDQRRAFLKSLVINLIMQGKIKTTEARAKEIRGLAERLITKTKKGDLANIRFAQRFLPKTALNKLVKEIAPKYKERAGGYTRIVKLGQRSSDGAPVVFIEFI
ncbi:MAG: 50S ribosomal protein L17 [Parcubacteria group bacterium CG1_02_40_82]|uniref:50S ribosomal protein L17 n=4 Tax=Candidatus Portnoyibacteriota TaxID=1817913 RepID=A0A2M7IIY9_9BACT|nr:MAG: 50S ribosomal protein L17 [Parcubacteria group bacterium CG1_02_40_82]PIQ75066.1 MAG: 50S ribosomal protein L17 [Candidatus Portnoybacteria bacterium CG11_big_fil_rev_8_21_14_0_20_40_15]PIS30540.1 MAG: 50S ribosomal protein L17 [Candidatus Portnoybacteria bacterium CG08_land_8_20_14_0_20_40_83]PIW76484.1 MAG: 50S ribosomal protein L17 [Candidatus Portnoybacteria bacterium CG_4_8_14_3_um_filter_40_10]PIY75365.1 MAG: 50S ribosomal protein L17 [Candidatus Portnoybacteria bacterium CG_4_10_